MLAKRSTVVLGHSNETELTIELQEAEDTELEAWHLRLHLDKQDADYRSTLEFFSCSREQLKNLSNELTKLVAKHVLL